MKLFKGEQPVDWEESSELLAFDPSIPPAISASSSCKDWMRPIKWNQGGYYALFVFDNSVTFILVTREETHSLEI